MRILHMIPDIGVANGVMSVILNYFRAMPDDIKFDVVYFAQSENTRQADIEALGGRVFKINPPSPKTLVRCEMDRFFKNHKGEWSALHIHAPHFTVFIAPAAKRAGIKKICCHCHSTLFSLKPDNLKRNELLNKPTEHLVDKKFACSKAAGDYWYNGEYEVLNNAIDCSKYTFNENVRKRVRDDLNLNGKLVIGHIGRADIIQKNHSFLLKIFAEIYKINPNSRLLLIGAEKTEETIKLCSEYEITDAVNFLGIRNDVNELLQAVDVFVFPSTKEGLPVSLIEAQAAGLPVLMSDSVTNEVVVTEDVLAMSLNDSVNAWANKAIELAESERKNTFKIMQDNNWDIKKCAGVLLNYYKK